MKRIVYVLTLIGLIFTGCDPVEDIRNDLNAIDNPVIADETYTLTSDDYDALGLDFGNFSSEENARLLLPDFLSDTFPFYGQGSSVLVNYNLFRGTAEGVSDYTGAASYELTTADYNSTGSDAPGFYPDVDATEEIPSILSAQITDPVEGQIILVEYDQYFEDPEIGLANFYEALFPADFSNFELISVSGVEDLGWSEDVGYIVGNGFNGDQAAVEEWIISPEIDLTGETDLLFQITQEIDFLGDPNLIDILVSTDYTAGGDVNIATWVAFDFDKTIYGSMTASEDFDFSDYDDQIIHVALKYSSIEDDPATTDDEGDASRWRVESFTIKNIGISGDSDSKGEYFVYEGGEWEASEGVYYLSAADYDSMGEEFGQPGRFNNFSNSTPADDYLPTLLDLLYPFAQEEEELFVIYKYFSSSAGETQTRGNLYTVIDDVWNGSESVIETSLQFGFNNGIWEPDNTIRYSLVGTDYTAIVNALSSTYPDATGSMSNFGNFERRPGNAAEWTNDMVLEALNIVLDNLDPSAEEEQKYVVTVDVYTGSNGTEEFAVIKEDGVWVYQTED